MKLAVLLACAAISRGATGNVVLLGEPIASESSSARHPMHVFDGASSTHWSSAGQGGWVGMAFPAAVNVSQILVMPRTDLDPFSCNRLACWDRGNGANVIEASNSADFSGAVTLDTLTRFPLISQLLYNPRPINTGGLSYRYWRMRSPSGLGDVAELRFVGPVTSGVRGQPVVPVISPFGGAYTSGSVTVTMTSATTSATIHYTVDSTPALCTSTTYDGPFTLTVGANTLVQAVACDASLSVITSDQAVGHFRNFAWGPVRDYDTVTGWPAQTFAGGIIGPIAGKYYQTGMWMNSGPCGQLGPPDLGPCSSVGTWLYSSTDALNWHMESQIIDDGTSGGKQWAQVQRSHIIHNASTGKYVMWSHCQGPTWTFGQSMACIASADAITGPWTWTNVSYDPGGGYRDCNLFLDNDGSAYTVATDAGQAGISIFHLAADYLSAVGDGKQLVSGGFEDPVLFRRGSVYYLIYSATTLYGQQSDPFYITSTSLFGTWSAPTRLYPGGPPLGSGGQPTDVIQIPGFTDAWFLESDLWQDPVAVDQQQRTRLVFSADSPPVMSVAPVPWSFADFH